MGRPRKPRPKKPRPLRPHPDEPAIRAAISKCERHIKPCVETAYRVTEIDFASRENAVTGQGSKDWGGRWNPPDLFKAVYSSRDAGTATAEYFTAYSSFGFATAQTRTPYVGIGIRVKVGRVLDLTDRRVRRDLGVTAARLAAVDWRSDQNSGVKAMTQAIGHAAYDAMIEALLVPSTARLRGVNLVVFPGNLSQRNSYLEILNRDQLPPPPGRT